MASKRRASIGTYVRTTQPLGADPAQPFLQTKVVGEIDDSTRRTACKKLICKTCKEVIAALDYLLTLRSGATDWIASLSCSSRAKETLNGIAGNVVAIRTHRARTAELDDLVCSGRASPETLRRSNYFVVSPDQSRVFYVCPLINFHLVDEWLEGQRVEVGEWLYPLQILNDQKAQTLAMKPSDAPVVKPAFSRVKQLHVNSRKSAAATS